MQIGLSLADIEASSAVDLDWLLEIHARHLKAQHPDTQSSSGTPGTVTRPLPPPGQERSGD